MTEKKPLLYCTQAQVANRLGVTRQAIAMWYRRYPDELPAPDAYLVSGKRENPTPIWTEESAARLLAWWTDRRRAEIARQERRVRMAEERFRAPQPRG